jgi:hypothetical protein
MVHVGMIYMNYDQKKGWEPNWVFDFQPQIPWKKESNEIWLEYVIHHWKNIFKSYKIFLSHFQKKLDLKKMCASKVLEQQEF